MSGHKLVKKLRLQNKMLKAKIKKLENAMNKNSQQAVFLYEADAYMQKFKKEEGNKYYGYGLHKG